MTQPREIEPLPQVAESPLVALMSAAMKQFGVGVLMAGVFAVACVRIYEDLAAKNAVLVEMVREQVSASKDVAMAINRLSEELRIRSANQD